MSKITNLREARETFEASGMVDFQWFDGFDQDELVEYIFRNSSDGLSLEDLVRSFLVLKGQDVLDYFPNR